MPDLLSRAIAVAVQAHAGQVDKSGQPYILHPLRVMLAMSGEHERVLAVLHDVAEDCPDWPISTICNEVGLGIFHRMALKALTRKPDETYTDFIERLSAHPTARAIKIADIHDNLRPGCPENLRERYARALNQLCPRPPVVGDSP